MAEIKNFPKPRINSFVSKSGKTYMVGRESQPFSTKNLPKTPRLDKPANKNLNPNRVALEKKWSLGDKVRTQNIIKGVSKPSVMGRAAGAIGRGLARGALRASGPIGALVGMTTPTGDGQEAKPSGPLMRGGMQPGYTYKGGVSVPTKGMLGPSKNSLSGASTRSGTGSGVIGSKGGGASTQRPGAGAIGTSKLGSTASKYGVTSMGSNAQKTKSTSGGYGSGKTGSSRFAKGGAIKRRKK